MATTEKIPNKVLKSFQVDDQTFHIMEPNIQIVRESKYRFSKRFTDAIKEGFYTKKKLEAVLKEGHADLVSAHIEKRATILNEMAETKVQMDQSKDPERIRYLAELLRIFRETLFQEDLSMKSLFDSTADNLAEEERVDYLTYSLVRDADFKLLWNSYDEYLIDNRYQFIESCKYNLLCWEFKIDPLWQETLPETEALARAATIIKDLEPKTIVEKDTTKVEKDVTKKPRVKRAKKLESKKQQPAEKR